MFNKSWMMVCAAVMGFLISPSASAVPSFARQTGMSCAACHTVFPELTPFGRLFKLNGYTLQSGKPLRDTGADKKTKMLLSEIPPLSAMAQISYTATKAAVPDSKVPASTAKNGEVLFPQQFSVFYAGGIAPKLGAFVQLTYDGATDHLGMDNADIRYADHALPGNRNLVYGVTLNNNPGVQDVWNTVPAWGFPYAASGVAPTPAAATLLDGGLAQNAAGLGAYVFWNNAVYGELSFYRSAKLGGQHPLDSAQSNVIQNVAPYWRLAWQRGWGEQNLEIGTYGMSADLYPGGGTPLQGATNRYTDIALDSQYQYIGDRNLFSAQAIWIHEKQHWDAAYAAGAAANPSATLDTFRLNGTYYRDRRLGMSLGYFSTSGSSDPGLYVPAPVTGSRVGSPNSAGEIVELNFLPWLNTKLALQYTVYNKFNGAGSNYDGSGRNASDNDTLYLLTWFAF